MEELAAQMLTPPPLRRNYVWAAHPKRGRGQPPRAPELPNSLRALAAAHLTTPLAPQTTNEPP